MDRKQIKNIRGSFQKPGWSIRFLGQIRKVRFRVAAPFSRPRVLAARRCAFRSFSISFLLFFILSFPFLVSCATVPGEIPLASSIPGHGSSQRGEESSVVIKTAKSTTDPLRPDAKHQPNSESYYHAILGLQYEDSRLPGSSNENDKNALREYLSALRHDPDAFFLLKRVATLYSRLGNQKDALFYAERAQRLEPDNGELLILLGDIYVVSGGWERGLGFYEQAVQLVSDHVYNTDVYFKIAALYAEQGDLTKAEEVIRKGMEVGSPSPFAYYYLGMLAQEKGTIEEGLELFREALSLDPYFEQAHLGIAATYERQGNAQAAMNVYRHVVTRINPRNQQAVNRLVQLLVQHGGLDEALALLTDLSQKDPSNPDLSLQLSRVFVEKKAFSNAIETILPVVKTRSADIRLNVYLASLYEENNEIENALGVYNSILERNPNEYEVRLRLGSLYFYKLKNPQEALSQGELARKINPQRAESYLFNGLILHDTQLYQDAVETFLSGIERNPKTPDLYFHLGATFDKLQRFDDMVYQMERAIELAPEHANALNYLGYTFADKGVRLNEAVELINRALVLRPDDGYFMDSLAWAYYRQGDLSGALALLQKAVSLVPGDPVIHEHLGEVYLKHDQMDLAKEEWERSLRLDPNNDKLIARFIEAGFGFPPVEGSAQRLKTQPQNTH